MHKHTKIKIIHSAQINLIIWNGNSSGNNELLMNAFTYCAGRSCLFIYMSYLVLIFHKRAGEHKLSDMYERAYGGMACICIHKRLYVCTNRICRTLSVNYTVHIYKGSVYGQSNSTINSQRMKPVSNAFTFRRKRLTLLRTSYGLKIEVHNVILKWG